MSRKTGYARKNLIPARDRPRVSPTSAGSRSSPRSSPPYCSNATDDDENDTDDDDETKELSPRQHAVRRGFGLSTTDDDGHDDVAAEEREELSPRAAAAEAEGSLPHPEEMRTAATSASASATSGGSGGRRRNAKLDAFLAVACPFLQLFDIARKEGPAIFWRILPSILVTKAFWLSLGTLFLCDLATLVAIVDEEKYLAYLDGGGGNATFLTSEETGDAQPITDASTVGDKDGDGMIKLTFGLWSYSTKLEDHSSTDDDVSFLISEEERLTSCSYHMLDVQEGMIFWLDPIFNTARAFGIIAVSVGFVAVVILWMGVIKVRVVESSDGGRRKFKGRGLKHTVTIALILCSAFEGLTLLIFQTGMCGNKRMETTYGQIYRDCEIAEGSSSPITAIVFWFLTGLAMLKLPADESGVIPSESARELGPGDGIAYGTGEDEDDDGDSYDMEEQQLGTNPSWWKRMLGFKSTGTSRVDRQRVDGYTTELQFDDDYEDDEWIDNSHGPGIQLRELT